MKRVFEFDDLFELLVHDIDTNVKYLEKLMGTPLFSNSPEIMKVHKNIQIIGVRLEEYANRMEELVNRKLRTEQKASPRPPIVA